MGEGNSTTIPIYYTIKELEDLYKHKKISFKELMLFKHRSDKIPIKTFKTIHYEDSSTKTNEEKNTNDSSTSKYFEN